MLLEKEKYLTSGMYIGMKTCTPYMSKFVYRKREDGLIMFNIKKIDDRLKMGADFLSLFKKILIVSKKETATQAVNWFAKAVDCRAVTSRFLPGTLTNPLYKDFYEPDIIFIMDPLIDVQAITEAKKKRIPIMSFCNSFNEAHDIDFIIPINNNGKKSIGLALFAMARQILKNRKIIKKDSEFKFKTKDFGGE